MDKLDIAVAGCGVAGLAAALLLQRAGHRVTLYDRFSEPQPLGSGLLIQPTGMAVLARLGLAREVVARGAVVRSIYGENRHGERVLNVHYSDLAAPGAFPVGIHRASLFDALYRAVVAERIPLHGGHEVAGSECIGGARRLIFASGERSLAHELVVDALGVSTPLALTGDPWLPYGALWATLAWPGEHAFRADRLEQRYDLARRMVGVLPTGARHPRGATEVAFFWSLRTDEYGHWQTSGLEVWKDEIRGLWPQCETLLDQIESPDQLTFARYAHRSLHRAVEDRLIHIGDAWHSASPQLGQGANMALLDSWALAQGLDRPGRLEARLAHCVGLRRSHVNLYQRLTAAFTPAYQSDSALPAFLRDVVLAPLSRIPPGPTLQAAMVSGLVGRPLRRLGLDLPDFGSLAPQLALNASATCARAAALDQS